MIKPCDLRKKCGKVDGPVIFFGGPYSNLQATLAMKKTAEDWGIKADHVFCTGDVLAYCGQPVETVDLIKDWGIHVVMGNCEESFGSDAPDCGCGFDAGTLCSNLSTEWYQFARTRLTPEQKSWMRRLPGCLELTIANHAIAVIHAGADLNNRFIFESTPLEVKTKQLDLINNKIVVAGHSGIPFGQLLDHRAWLNAGVIGLPANDGTRDGWYLVIQPSGGGLKASWHRLKYNAQSASNVMREQGLVGGYHTTLLNGLWPSQDILPEQEKNNQGRPLSIKSLFIT